MNWLLMSVRNWKHGRGGGKRHEATRCAPRSCCWPRRAHGQNLTIAEAVGDHRVSPWRCGASGQFACRRMDGLSDEAASRRAAQDQALTRSTEVVMATLETMPTAAAP